ncbi:deoxyribose-phosphate aldolase [Maridesulfovibrio hydrothermalis]|uniref:Deoxyribose-phosphate aldolase n=1 Tax=Maridesulfovibrio hydrothermalis AM13 = DSM 14728 TaxID=1121451 RepID=L0R911_9BACT|nr:deoxyribose-phosphate aldolase [Maridesulfovibrio hydrothermalis]CCO22066.1 Deoxyribose-phosphate aldolase [Maridesulfovibrio hydrothermalis AM13 = DSM 14728]
MDKIENLAAYIDHTLLDVSAGESEIEQLCRDAVEFGFASVCVHPCHIVHASELLFSEETMVCSVIGFPCGASMSEVKMLEAMRAVDKGAQELDMVVNIGALKAGDRKTFLNDVFMTVEGAGHVPVKAIIETGLLNDDQKKLACELAVTAGASFVKTCTGFGPGCANVDDIRLMRSIVGNAAGVKASGGIKTYEQACELVAAGATRLGTSSSVSIVRR